MDSNKGHTMKKTLRDPNANKARRARPGTPPPSHIMRESMVLESTSAARAAGLSQINTQLNKPLPPLPQPETEPAQRTATKSASGRGRLAEKTMRKPKAAASQGPDAQPASSVSGSGMWRSGRRHEGHSYPPSAWKPLSQHARAASTGSQEASIPRRPVPAGPLQSRGPETHVEPPSTSSDYANNIGAPRMSLDGLQTGNGSRWARQYPARDEQKNLQRIDTVRSNSEVRPQTAGARIVGKLSSWSRSIREKRAGQHRPSTADTSSVAIPRDSSHWGPFRAAVEKVMTGSRPPSREVWRPIISHPIDNGRVFDADFIERQERMPQSDTAWVEAQLAGRERVIPLEMPRDVHELRSRDTQASMDSRITQMADFIEFHSRPKQPAPKPGLISKFAGSRSSSPRPYSCGNTEGSPLDFACRGEWIDPEPDYNPFKELDEVLTDPEPSSSNGAHAVDLGITVSDPVSANVHKSGFECPQCRQSEGIQGERCSHCGWTENGSRRSPPKYLGAVRSGVPEIIPQRLSIYSQHPVISSESHSTLSRSGTNGSHSSRLRRSYHVNVDLTSLAGSAYHEAKDQARSASPAVSSVYSPPPMDCIYDDPGNPFADQHAIDAYRNAMDRWHPAPSQVTPLSVGTTSFAQHREEVLQNRKLAQQALEDREKVNMNTSSLNPYGYPAPTARKDISGHGRDTLYTLTSPSDDEVSAGTIPLDKLRETWMTLDTSYQPYSRSRGTHATTISDNRPSYHPRSFASRAAEFKRPIEGPGPRSSNDKRWPYSPNDFEFPSQ